MAGVDLLDVEADCGDAGGVVSSSWDGGSKESVTETTCAPTSELDRRRPGSRAVVGIGSPSGAWKTMFEVKRDCWGNRSARASAAFWESAPGSWKSRQTHHPRTSQHKADKGDNDPGGDHAPRVTSVPRGRGETEIQTRPSSLTGWCADARAMGTSGPRRGDLGPEPVGGEATWRRDYPDPGGWPGQLDDVLVSVVDGGGRQPVEQGPRSPGR